MRKDKLMLSLRGNPPHPRPLSLVGARGTELYSVFPRHEGYRRPAHPRRKAGYDDEDEESFPSVVVPLDGMKTPLDSRHQRIRHRHSGERNVTPVKTGAGIQFFRVLYERSGIRSELPPRQPQGLRPLPPLLRGTCSCAPFRALAQVRSGRSEIEIHRHLRQHFHRLSIQQRGAISPPLDRLAGSPNQQRMTAQDS